MFCYDDHAIRRYIYMCCTRWRKRVQFRILGRLCFMSTIIESKSIQGGTELSSCFIELHATMLAYQSSHHIG